MEIEIQLTREPIVDKISPPKCVAQGAWLEFLGVVRDEESGEKISALEYEAYPDMAASEIRRLLEAISSQHPCLVAKIIHRIGIIPAGETAIYVGVASAHRAEAIALLAEFMDKLKQDVPIWKRRALPIAGDEVTSLALLKEKAARPQGPKSLDEAIAEISSRCPLLPPVNAPLEESFGRILRETVCAANDLPESDRSTRDGYAILENDSSESFQIVDTLHAADWKPRQLKDGETVRIATGASLPCGNLRVIMQENVERKGDRIRILKAEKDSNVRKRGEEVKAGSPLIQAGAHLDTGKLALLASVGCVRPLVSPQVQVIHFTTGDEVIPPDQTPRPGQIRDSNSTLIFGLLQKFRCGLTQSHLREDFETAKAQLKNQKEEVEKADVVLVSGGASVGDKDFTRPLLESLGFEIVFSQVSIRPGRPIIFGVSGNRIAFGLPGNPLSHFVGFHLFVAAALAKLRGGWAQPFLRGRLAAALNDALNPRETLWPARLKFTNTQAGLHPLNWSSSGDLTCLTQANALVRIPPDSHALDAGSDVDFLPVGNDYYE